MILPKEEQLVSLELAKRMKELGFRQDSLFKYYVDLKGGYTVLSTPPFSDYHEDYVYSAYTVAELGAMLPKKYVSGRGLYDNEFWCGAFDDNPNNNKDKVDKTEANARAKILIYLKENNLI